MVRHHLWHLGYFHDHCRVYPRLQQSFGPNRRALCELVLIWSARFVLVMDALRQLVQGLEANLQIPVQRHAFPHWLLNLRAWTVGVD